MKNIILSLMLVVFASACSHKTESTVSTQTAIPQFSVAPGDVVSTSVENMTGRGASSSPTQEMYEVHIELSGAKAAQFRQFTKDHVSQKVQILVGAKVVQEPVIFAEIISPKMDLLYSTPAEAQTIADVLSKK